MWGQNRAGPTCFFLFIHTWGTRHSVLFFSSPDQKTKYSTGPRDRTLDPSCVRPNPGNVGLKTPLSLCLPVIWARPPVSYTHLCTCCCLCEVTALVLACNSSQAEHNWRGMGGEVLGVYLSSGGDDAAKEGFSPWHSSGSVLPSRGPRFNSGSPQAQRYTESCLPVWQGCFAECLVAQMEMKKVSDPHVSGCALKTVLGSCASKKSKRKFPLKPLPTCLHHSTGNDWNTTYTGRIRWWYTCGCMPVKANRISHMVLMICKELRLNNTSASGCITVIKSDQCATEMYIFAH